MNNISQLLGNSKEPTKNPLENLNEAENKKPPKSSSSTFDKDVVANMIMAGDNSTGIFTPNKEDVVEEKDIDKINVDTDEQLEVTTGETLKTSKKYQNALLKDMIKHPDKFKIITPEGEMTVAEALKRGYDPVTKEFTESESKKRIKVALDGLNEKDKSRVEELINPANVGLAPADGEALGLPANNEMIKRPNQESSNPEASQEQVATQQAPQQEGNTAPTPDIAALLGQGGMM